MFFAKHTYHVYNHCTRMILVSAAYSNVKMCIFKNFVLIDFCKQEPSMREKSGLSQRQLGW